MLSVKRGLASERDPEHTRRSGRLGENAATGRPSFWQRVIIHNRSPIPRRDNIVTSPRQFIDTHAGCHGYLQKASLAVR